VYKYALVIGCANGVWDEVEHAKRLYPIDCYIAINHVGVHYERVDHWVSFHVELFPHWVGLRKANKLPPVKSFWTSTYTGSQLRRSFIEDLEIQRIRCEGGSSGLIGVMVGLKLAEKVVLVGIPLEPNQDHFHKSGAWDEALLYRQAWLDYLPQLKGRVRSMSGWTQEILND
jgi:hypothetical protein